MGHFAKVENGVVTRVIVADQEWIDTGLEGDPSLWVQTSYNTQAGVHTSGGTPLRGNFAGMGYVYDKTNDVFYPPRPKDYLGVVCNSWTIGAPTWTWQPPVAWPGEDYDWNETTKTWDKNRNDGK